MKRTLNEALAECLARMDSGASIEECLRGQGALAEQLRPLLETAAVVRARSSRIPEHTLQGIQGGRARMHAARGREAAGGSSPWLAFFGRPAALVGIAALVALVAALGFTTELFRFGADTTSAHVEGVVSRVDPDAIVLVTVDGQVIISLGDDTTVFDAEGEVISGGQIAPGRSVSVEVEVEDGAFAAQRIEVRVEIEGDDEVARGAEVEFEGVIQTVSDGTIELGTSFGGATVLIDALTELEGPLVAGMPVEVHATLQPDGSYLAREIEVEGPEDDDGGHRGDDDDDGPSNSGPGSSGSGISGSGDGDDHEPDDSGSGLSGDGADDGLRDD